MTLHSRQGAGIRYHVTIIGMGRKPAARISAVWMQSGADGNIEEERRLAHVGLTRAKKRAKITFAQNRRTHGLWQQAMPSRFIDELPEDSVEVEESTNQYGGYGASRFDDQESFLTGDYGTPGWQRARARKAKGGSVSAAPTLDGEYRVIASETAGSSDFQLGERIFHQKFGYGAITRIDGNKLTVDFEKAGQKKVVDSFVERH